MLVTFGPSLPSWFSGRLVRFLPFSGQLYLKTHSVFTTIACGGKKETLSALRDHYSQALGVTCWSLSSHTRSMRHYHTLSYGALQTSIMSQKLYSSLALGITFWFWHTQSWQYEIIEALPYAQPWRPPNLNHVSATSLLPGAWCTDLDAPRADNMRSMRHYHTLRHSILQTSLMFLGLACQWVASSLCGLFTLFIFHMYDMSYHLKGGNLLA